MKIKATFSVILDIDTGGVPKEGLRKVVVDNAADMIARFNDSDLDASLDRFFVIDKETDSEEEEPIKYRNFYKCSECGHEWEDEWSCMCNDRCPDCDAEIEPYKSEEIEDEA